MFSIFAPHTISHLSHFFFTLDTIASFRAAVRRSTSSYSRKQSTFSRQESTFSRQESTFSRQQSREDRPSFSRQASTQDPFAATDHLSRFSLEALPVIAHPSPSPGREGFPTPRVDTMYVEDDDVSEEVKVPKILPYIPTQCLFHD